VEDRERRNTKKILEGRLAKVSKGEKDGSAVCVPVVRTVH
jgi:hypothetical protein